MFLLQEEQQRHCQSTAKVLRKVQNLQMLTCGPADLFRGVRCLRPYAAEIDSSPLNTVF